jgi:hypothetical protein
MFTRFLPALCLCVLLVSNQSTRSAEEAPWVTLFNGKDLSGWVSVNDGVFQVTDGNLHLAKGEGWLRTEKEYKDFVLELEWRALSEKYDSGIFVRSGAEGKPWPDGGWQINLKSNQLGALVKGSRTVVPAESDPEPVNKWVKFRIEVKGKKIVLFVNGEKAWESDALDRESGFIGIEAEGHAFDFRAIRIQELK